MKSNMKTLLSLLKEKRLALEKADPQSRDRLRRQVRALEVAKEIKKEVRRAA